MAKRIVLAGGGTGGHLFPLIAVAKKIKKIEPKAKFLYLGPMTEMEKEIMGGAGIAQKRVVSGKLYRYFTFRYLINIFRMPWGILQALWKVLWYMPDVVFAKGGYASVPVVMAARLYRIPVLIHESDAKPGLANRFLGSIASRIALTFERAKIHFPPTKTFVSGNPINPNAINGDREKGRQMLNIHKEAKPVVLVIGGSQGAQLINQRILKDLKRLLEQYQIVHLTGKNNYDWAVSEAQRQGFKIEHSDYYPLAFITEGLNHLMALADVVISRAGSTAIAEIAANQKPAILVPSTHSANDHNRINAFEVSRAGGAIVLEENNLRENLLLHELKQATQNGEVRAKLVQNIQKFYHPDATEKISQKVLELAD